MTRARRPPRPRNPPRFMIAFTAAAASVWTHACDTLPAGVIDLT